METLVHDIIGKLGNLHPLIAYLFFFISAILQITFPPYPGDSVFIFGGYLGSIGLFGGNIPIFISYWGGTVLSSYALYELGVWKGESILKFKIISKYFPDSTQKKAKIWILKYGLVIFFICKFIPGLNSIIITLGGILRYNKFWAYIGVGFAAAIHNIIFFMVGKAIGDNWNNINHFLAAYNKGVFGILILGLLVYLAYMRNLKRKRRNMKSNDTEH